MPDRDVAAANVPRPAPFVSLEICDGRNTRKRKCNCLIEVRLKVRSERATGVCPRVPRPSFCQARPAGQGRW